MKSLKTPWEVRVENVNIWAYSWNFAVEYFKGACFMWAATRGIASNCSSYLINQYASKSTCVKMYKKFKSHGSSHGKKFNQHFWRKYQTARTPPFIRDQFPIEILVMSEKFLVHFTLKVWKGEPKYRKSFNSRSLG